MFFYAPVVQVRPDAAALTSLQKVYWLILICSTTLTLAGFTALFWHFGWWIGALFGISSFAAFRVYRYWANQAKKRAQPP
jgi:hypothetical protein